jgi:predicted acetyltransferase
MTNPGPDVELRSVTPDELPEVIEAFDRTFGMTTTEESIHRTRLTTEPDRTVAARSVDGEVVGTAGSYSFELSLPFGRRAGCAGVTRVSVRADHRRRGVLTAMVRWLLDDAAAHGEPFAALWASESPIYGRFGFGPAAPTVHVELDRRHAQLGVAAPVHEVRLVDADEAASSFAAIYDRASELRPGMLSRSPAWWQRLLFDPPSQRHGAGPLRLALVPGRGYAIHRLRSDWQEGVPVGTVDVEDLVAIDPEAQAALWRFVTDTDLAVRTVAGRRPVDDPLFTSLVDPVRARVTTAWPLQLRLVDVPAAFEARGYGTDGRCRFALDDAFVPANAGTWELVVDGGRASCSRIDATTDVDLHLDAGALASLHLGGVAATQLVASGRIPGDRDAAASLDRLLASDVAPWHGGMF